MRPSKQSKELAGALAEDHKRQVVDAAKKRAVAQQVDYDTFKKMVSVAHLKPLQAPSSTPTGCLMPAWGIDPTGILSAPPSSALHAASASISRMACPGADTSISTSSGATHVPRNSREFLRDWRRNCPTAAAKYRLLKLCGADGLSQMFKIEITGELLSQVLSVLQQEWNQHAQSSSRRESTASAGPEHAPAEACSTEQPQEAISVTALLHSLTGAGRFDLNARLMGSKAKQVAEQLCNDLQTVLQQHGCNEANSALSGGTNAASMPDSAGCVTSGGPFTASHVNSSSSSGSLAAVCGRHSPPLEEAPATDQQVEGMRVAESNHSGQLPLQEAWQNPQQLASNASKALEQLAHIRQKLHIATQ